MRERGELAKQGAGRKKISGGTPTDSLPTLADLGVDRHLSATATALCQVPEAKLEQAIEKIKDKAHGELTKAAVIREVIRAPARDAKQRDPVAFIVSANLARRNLTEGQQAMVLAMIYPEPPSASERGKEGGRGKKKGEAAEKAPAKSAGAFGETRLRQAHAALRIAKEYDAMKIVTAVLARKTRPQRNRQPTPRPGETAGVFWRRAGLRGLGGHAYYVRTKPSKLPGCPASKRSDQATSRPLTRPPAVLGITELSESRSAR